MRTHEAPRGRRTGRTEAGDVASVFRSRQRAQACGRRKQSSMRRLHKLVCGGAPGRRSPCPPRGACPRKTRWLADRKASQRERVAHAPEAPPRRSIPSRDGKSGTGEPFASQTTRAAELCLAADQESGTRMPKHTLASCPRKAGISFPCLKPGFRLAFAPLTRPE